MLMNIQALRQDIKTQRQALPVDEQRHLAHGIHDTLLDQTIIHNAQHIAVYLAYYGEVPTDDLVIALRSLGKTLYLPTLQADPDPHLCFMPYHENTPLAPNRFGIEEPAFDEHLAILPTELDCVITPLVAFDKNCHRVGMGAGYYDRTFAFLNQAPRPDKPYLVGLAYDFQRVDTLEPQDWDVPLNAVITEHGLYQRILE